MQYRKAEMAPDQSLNTKQLPTTKSPPRKHSCRQSEINSEVDNQS